MGLSWDKVRREEPEERKGRGPGGLSSEGSTLSPSPSAFLPPLPTVTEEGPLGARSWASAGMEKGRDPQLVTQYCWIIPHPLHAPLTLTQPVSPACARKMRPEGALLRRLKARYRHWSDGSLQPRERKEAKGSGISQGSSMSHGLDQPQALKDPRKDLLSAPGPLLQLPLQNGREGRLQGDGAEAVQVLPLPRP